jgi:prepilin-type N-terminal cleavage/methylation domain-containing protein
MHLGYQASTAWSLRRSFLLPPVPKSLMLKASNKRNIMKKLNSKGFSIVEILLVILIITVLGGIGYMVYSNHNKAATKTETTNQTNTTKPATSTKPKTITVDYSSWVKGTQAELSENQTAQYKAKSGNATLSVYSTKPIIFYSPNAPYYCKYENNQWVAYSGTNTTTNPTIVYTKEATNANCDTVKKETIKDLTAYTRYGGAEARISLSAAVENGAEWLVFKDYIDSPDIESVTEAQAAKDKATLNASIETLIDKTLVAN